MRIKEFFHSRKARDKPKDYYTGTDFRYPFGPTTSGKNVNEFTAMQTTGSRTTVLTSSAANARST